MIETITEGEVYSVKYPFFKVDLDETSSIDSDYGEWTPGCRSVMIYPDDCGFVANGEGSMELTVVSIHKPGRYPTRVFYTRKFTDPDGRVFGNKKLRIATQTVFNKRIAGYYHEYELE